MKTPLGNKVIGFTLAFLSILGILFSLSGIIATWVVRPRIRDLGMEILTSLEEAFSTSQDGFILLDQAIDDLLLDLDIIEESFQSLDTTMEGISSSLEISADLIGDDLKQTVLNTQTALDSSAATAELIDNTLAFLARIPLLGVDYDPEVPLHISLEQIEDNLINFPETLEQIEEGLNTTTNGIASLRDDLQNLEDQLQGLETDLESAQEVMVQFSDSIGVMEKRLGLINENFPVYITVFSLMLTGILFWLGLSQIFNLTHGIHYFRGYRTIVNPSDFSKK